MPASPTRRVFLLLGNQLFSPSLLRPWRDAVVFMSEDRRSCTYVRHHQQKLVFILAAMRAHADLLREEGFSVRYQRLDSPDSELDFPEKLRRLHANEPIATLTHFEFEDRAMETRIAQFAESLGIEREVVPSPMFLCSRDEFASWLGDRKRVLMADFYRWQRQQRGILLDGSGQPAGGRWSHDADNRKSLPAAVGVPDISLPAATCHVGTARKLVADQFADHPGSTTQFWLPTTRAQALTWFNEFLEQRLPRFGDYQDALTQRSEFVFHSALAPLMNVGLLTPDEIVASTLDFAQDESIDLNSIEGFIRQIVGWREFVRGLYHCRAGEFTNRNFWNHRRGLSRAWLNGETGLPPLDQVVEKTRRLGWAHHIERLMVVGSLMQLCEIHPREAYRWFMENFVDAGIWVMVPNVYGMALYADGGIFATKPYVCGSSYLLRMGDYRRGAWTDTVDGLFWRFIGRHRAFFSSQPRLKMLVANLDRMSPDRRSRIDASAESFLSRMTTETAGG